MDLFPHMLFIALIIIKYQALQAEPVDQPQAIKNKAEEDVAIGHVVPLA